jgi:multicomponent Na+:H+ antiporter subunit E
LPVAGEKSAYQDQPSRPRASRLTHRPTHTRFHAASFFTTFIIMAFFWVIFSGRFDLFHISLGIASCFIVAALSADLLYPSKVKPGLVMFWLRFAVYVPWLLYQILLANLYVLRLSFHPRMMMLIDPQIIEFNSHLDSDIARTTFANSITLTPGTITVNVSAMGRFTVHCIDGASGESLPGEMERQIARIFKE